MQSPQFIRRAIMTSRENAALNSFMPILKCSMNPFILYSLGIYIVVD